MFYTRIIIITIIMMMVIIYNTCKMLTSEPKPYES